MFSFSVRFSHINLREKPNFLEIKIILWNFQMASKTAVNMCFMQIFWLLIFTVYDVNSTLHDDYKTIETNYGLVRGKRGTTLLDNIPYYSFRGIPYAKAPTGSLRFKVTI